MIKRLSFIVSALSCQLHPTSPLAELHPIRASRRSARGAAVNAPSPGPLDRDAIARQEQNKEGRAGSQGTLPYARPREVWWRGKKNGWIWGRT